MSVLLIVSRLWIVWYLFFVLVVVWLMIGLMLGKIFMLFVCCLCLIVFCFMCCVNVVVLLIDGECVNMVFVYLFVRLILVLDELVWKIIGCFCGECWMFSGFVIWKKWLW